MSSAVPAVGRAVPSVLGRILALVVVVSSVGAVVAPVADADEGPVRYVEPVDAPIIDPFRAPVTPYAPGNRGVEYDTDAGQQVRAVAPGQVLFAGDVGGTLHVTVLHGDGRRSSYSFLQSVAVRTGSVVDGGQPVGQAAETLHVGMREGDVYVDPAALFGSEVVRVQLIPENPAGSPTWNATAAEIQAMIRLTMWERGPGILDRLGDAAAWAWDHASEHAPQLLDLALWAGELFVTHPLVRIVVFDIVVPLALGQESPLWEALKELSPHHVLVRTIERGMAWWHQRSQCTPSDVDPPAPSERRVAVLVGGLGSTSSDAAIGGLDADALGYAAGDVMGFSYAGGRIPGTFDGGPGAISSDLAGIDVNGYGEGDSTQALAGRGALLADLLEDVARSAPGAPIDLYGHSQGGVVLRLALAELARRPGGGDVIASLGLVATMSTPHQGSDLATAALVAAGTGEGQTALRIVDDETGFPVDPARATNIADLALDAELLGDLAESGLPEGPSYLSVGARGDLVVPDTRASMEGAAHVTVPLAGPTAHDDVPADPATTRELALARAGMEPTCQGLFDVMLDGFVAEVTHAVHVRLGVAVAIGESYATLPDWAVDGG
jgi:hypothetical protein